MNSDAQNRTKKLVEATDNRETNSLYRSLDTATLKLRLQDAEEDGFQAVAGKLRHELLKREHAAQTE